MRYQQLALVAVLVTLAVAQDIAQNNIPSQCFAFCADVISIAQRCENTTDNDTAELDCICRTPNAGTLLPTCEACVSEYDDKDNDVEGTGDAGNEVYDVLTRCGFSAAYYNAQSASSVLVSVASSFAQASGSVVVTTSGTAVLLTSVRASTQVPSQTAGAAPARTAAVGMGVLGLAVGLL
ncbi:hypothetical protein DE146DRAFT_768844 [Phaeosphaeria sp. MPI-PUGE-AT-0046c]|nr:hypothetical protein DE146DRAFT_768844 [Phaeosphaeria sp. MPI-PUGE-AT-0046c]